MKEKANIRSTETEVRNVPQPKFTNTWHPWNHNTVLDVLETAVKRLDLAIVHKQYSMNANGLKMVGAWGIDSNKSKNSNDHQIYSAIIFRNSMDKSVSLGIAGGTHASVCTNLMIFGEYVEFRKHTGRLDIKSIQRAIFNGIDDMKPRLEEILNWHEALSLIMLSASEVKELAYDAIYNGILSKHNLPTFHNLLFAENHIYSNDSLFGFHGACTETIRDINLVSGGMQTKQNKLHRMIHKKFSNRLPILNGMNSWFNKEFETEIETEMEEIAL